MRTASLLNRFKALAAALLREGWWLRRDPAVGFQYGVRKRCRRWRVTLATLDGNCAIPAGPADAVSCLETARDWTLNSIVEASERAWHQVRPGGWFACACQLPVHEACAVFTLHGWHTEQVFEELPEAGQCVLVLQRPMGQAFRKVTVDWAAERQGWSQRKGRTRAARSSIAAAPPAPGRRCQVFGVGIAKSGTSSLAGMFEAYRSAHEFEPTATIERVLRQVSGGEVSDWNSWLQERDRRSGGLECDSSQLHVWYLADLVKCFPEARFVLTVRHPIPWLDSILNHHLARGRLPSWAALDQHRFGKPPFTYQAGEALLERLGLPPVGAWFEFWKTHHQRVLTRVPAERLLVLELDQLADSIETVAAFAGIGAATLSAESAHRNEARACFRVVERLDQGFLAAQFEHHSRSVWDSLTASRVRSIGNPVLPGSALVQSDPPS